MTSSREAHTTDRLVDIQTALRNLNGNRENLYGLLQRFRERHLGDAAKIQQSLLTDDSAEAQRLAHSLKSLTATLGIEKIRNQAAVIEHEIKINAKLSSLTTLVASLEQGLQQLNVEILELVPDNTQTRLALIESKELYDKLDELGHLLGNDNIGAGEVWLEVKPSLTQLLGTESIAALNEQIENYDLPGALQTLQALIQQNPSLQTH